MNDGILLMAMVRCRAVKSADFHLNMYAPEVADGIRRGHKNPGLKPGMHHSSRISTAGVGVLKIQPGFLAVIDKINSSVSFRADDVAGHMLDLIALAAPAAFVAKDGN